MPNKILKFFHFLEDSMLVTLITSLLLLSCTQILLRNLGVSGLMWADTSTRILVLWLAFFGAMRASRLQNHISIDLLSHYGNQTVQKIIHFIVSISSAAICGTASYYCWLFVQIEKEDGAIAFLIVPVWLCEIIIPFGLAIITLRFIFNALTLPASYEYDT